MSEDLKPCPFCGAGEMRVDRQNMWTGQRNQLVCVHVRHWCEKPSRSTVCVTANTEQEAVDNWNRRASLAQQAGEDARDAIRLDWLEKQLSGHGFCHTSYGEYRFYAHQLSGYPTVREVIDQAMKGGE